MFSIEVAVFLRLVKERHLLLMNAWVPLDFMARQVDEEIDNEDSPVNTRTLRRELRKASLLGRPFVETDDPSLRNIVKIFTTNKKVFHRKESVIGTKDGKKKKDFVYVQERGKAPFEWPATEQRITKHFQDQYDFFGRRIVLNIQPTAEQTTTCNQQARPRAVTPTETEAILQPCNRDIRALFDGILDDKALARLDIDERSVALLRNRVKDLSHDLHKAAVKDRYNSSERDNIVQYQKKDIATLDEDLYPTLTHQFGVPLSIDAFKALGSAVGMVAHDVPEALDCFLDSTGYKSSKQSTSNDGLMKATVPSSNAARLYANAKNWMPTALQAAIREDSELTRKDAVVAFAKVLWTVDKGAFSEVCSLKWKETAKKIDPYHQKALRFESGMSDRQFEIVRKYTIHALNRNFWQPVEKVRALDSECFPPFRIKFRDNHRNRVCWYRPIDKAFKWLINKDLTSTGPTVLNRTDVSQIKECHILLGGDHGQGAFHVVVTVLLFFKNSSLAFQGDILCGHIDCQKDTYAVLERTITDPLNNSLNRIGNELAFCQAPDGSLYVAWGSNSPDVRAYRGVEEKAVRHIGVHTVSGDGMNGRRRS
ncbi:hypothetical protein SEMRO_773_G200460.1 [Seminavis robusta]|uniref:Uncharacterized protein n=1 Tax=Seminavis robusta TaxID=568900 RepID=A0A9N8EBR6_9STRA|nr:hypothetical protein SEMRO_773_G200460.1 [Seminavis robusta]|eukprot:Sro773_g200460.1 n/a (595) ;mRNA; r:25476-27327